MDQIRVLIGDGTDVWTIVSSLSGVGAALVAIVGLFAALEQLRHNATAIQLQVFESVFRDIRDLDRQHIESWDTFNDSKRKAWSASFFNTLEYMVFLMNHNVVRQEELCQFFKDALPHWYETFGQHVADGTLRDGPNMFAELKRACQKPDAFNV